LYKTQGLEIAQSQPSYHFFEWLAAVLVFQTFGYLSLLEQYEFKAHERKCAVLRDLILF
jgi:hypothetical protein